MARTAHPETTAVVVTCGATPYLPRTLQGIFEQTYAPTRLVIVNIWRRGRDPGTGDDIQTLVSHIGLDTVTRVRVLAAAGAVTFGDAVRQGLELNAAAQQRAEKLHETRTGEIPVIHAGTSPGWLWLLHDDSAPDPQALERLVRTGETGPSIAVVGAKQRGWENPALLLEVGIRATSSARRFNPVEHDEIDQGQYDHLDDVLAVGMAGALIRRDVWVKAGGPDPALGPFGDGLELSRRVRLAGYRVVVEPTAIVYHARASYLGMRSFGHGRPSEAGPDVARSFGARRKAQLYNWVVATPGWKLPFLLALLLVLSPLRALIRLATRDVMRARAELAAGAAVLSRPDLWLAARRRTRRSAVIPPSTLAALETDSADIRRARRDHRLGEADIRRTRATPSELEMRELADINARRRTVATVVAFAAATLAAFALFGIIGAPALTGGGVLPDSGRLGAVWDRAFSPWLAHGDGYAGPADPVFGVLALPLVFGGTLSEALKWLILLGVPLAAMSAWAAAGTATRSTALRALSAIVWATGPLMLAEVGEGRVGALLAHIAAPLVIAFTARAMGLYRRDNVLSGLVGARHVRLMDDDDDDVVADRPLPVDLVQEEPRRRSVSAAAVAALAFAVVSAGSPPLLIVGTALLLVTTLASRARAAIWFIPIPALVLYGPWLQEMIASRTWRALFASPGVPVAQDAAAPWQLLLGIPHALPLAAPYDLLVLVPGAALLVVALLALFRGTGRARAVRVGLAVSLVGLALALAAPQITVAHTAAGEAVQGWGGHGVTLLTLGFLLAAVCGADGLRDHLRNYGFGPRQFGVFSLAVVVAAATLVAPAVWALALGQGTLVREARSPMTPALSQQLASGTAEARTLALIPTETALRATVWRGDGPQMSETSMLLAARAVGSEADDAAAESLAHAVARAAVGGNDTVAQELAAHAIGVVIVPPSEEPGLSAQRDALIASLSTVPGVVYVTTNEAGAVYRVIVDDPASRASEVARVQLFEGDEFRAALAMTAELEPSSTQRRVVLAERADPAWTATLGGLPLEPATADGEWQQSFTVTPGGGTLAIEFAPPLHTWWLWAQGLVMALTVIVAAPRRRKDREAA